MMSFAARGLSMEPLIMDGDRLFVEPKKREDVGIGDILAYRSPSDAVAVAHRLVRIVSLEGKTYYEVEGDFSRVPERVGYEHILGCVAGFERRGKIVDLDGVRERFLKAQAKRFPFLRVACLAFLRWRPTLYRFYLFLSPRFFVRPPAESLASIREKFRQEEEVSFHSVYLEGKLEDWEEEVVRRYLTKKGASVLDVGCGAGREAFALRRPGFSVTAVDISPEMIEAGRSKSAESGLEIDFRVMAASEIDFPPGSFDYCLMSRDIYSFIPSRALRIAALQRIAAALKPGGLIFLSGYVMPPAVFSGSWVRDALRRVRNFLLPGVFSSEPGDGWMRGVSPQSRLDTFCYCHFFGSEREIADELKQAGFLSQDSGIEHILMARIP